jgi:uncharacterized protein (TIGR00159 family)
MNVNRLEIFLSQFLHWQTLLDIGVITIGIFFLYRTLIRLGTWKILAGIFFAFMVFVFASLLDLEGVEWIFQNISHVAVLAMIVIFQPELRKMFEKVVSLYGRKRQVSSGELPDVIANSLWALASVKSGALLVITGKESLDDKISGGYQLDGDLSIPIIQSIFDHHSPGHDGAAIIANDKIRRFGVRLPISQSGRLTNDLGTRHHAAMGLSEQSDAIVFAVSEERGKVSYFANGRMQVMPSPEAIVSTIEEHSRNFGFFHLENKSGISKRIAVQFSICLVLAIVFWSSLIVVNKQIVERVITVPVEYSAPKNGLVLVGEKVNEVKVHLSGTKADLDNLSNDQASVFVSLGEMNEGERAVLITEDNLKLPRNITLLDATPESLEINLAEIVQKTVPVVPQLIGKITDAREIKRIIVDPEFIEVLTPPARDGAKNINLSTTPIYLGSIESTSTTIYCKVIAPPYIQPLDKKWPHVKVTIELDE